MSLPQPPKPAKLVVGLFTRDKDIIVQLASELCGAFGSFDLVSPWLPFDYTTYYEREMGAPLFRRVFAFQALIEQSELSAVKTKTNRIEDQYASNGKRIVNIDPGYLSLERFVLASGKNFSHRIYIGQGIYADLTLIYQHGTFEKLPWTYPDYADQPVLAFLEKVRNKYTVDLKAN
jgi:hypothetical protein